MSFIDEPALFALLFSLIGLLLGMAGLLGIGIVGSNALGGYKVLEGWKARIVGAIYFLASWPVFLVALFENVPNPPAAYRDTLGPLLFSDVSPAFDVPWFIIGMLAWALLMASASIAGVLLDP